MSRLAAIALGIVSVAGCVHLEDDDPVGPRAADATPSGARKASRPSSGAGPEEAREGRRPAVAPRPVRVNERDFRALHERRSDEALRAKGEMVDLAGGRAYLSLPEESKSREGPLPAVIVVHEWWGLNSHIKHWADRLSREGYAALAVDLYAGQVATTSERAMALMNRVDEDRAHRILGAAFEFLAQDERVRAEKRAVIGWCFGGGWALRLAIAAPVDAAVVYYGRVVTDPRVLQKIRGRVLGIFGRLDEGIPAQDVDDFEAALGAAHVRHQVLRFDAQHAFANPSSARYDEGAAREAWSEVQELLRSVLKGDK